jgi:hypothetical protein
MHRNFDAAMIEGLIGFFAKYTSLRPARHRRIGSSGGGVAPRLCALGRLRAVGTRLAITLRPISL